MEDFDFIDEPASENKKPAQKYVLIALIVVTALLAGAVAYLWNQNTGYKEQSVKQLEESKKVLESNMQDLLDLQEAYSGLSVQYDTINQQLDSSRVQVEILLEKLQNERSISDATIRQYQKELGTLRAVMKSYVHQIDSLNALNKKLISENAAVRKEADSNRKQAEELTRQVETLTSKVSEGAVIKAYDIFTEAVTDKGKKTDRSSRTVDLVTSLTLGANELAEKGPVSVYVRITDPAGYLMVGETQSTFEYNGEQMQCSACRRDVDYQGTAVSLSVYLKGEAESAKGQFSKGIYTIEVYSDKALLGTTELMLR